MTIVGSVDHTAASCARRPQISKAHAFAYRPDIDGLRAVAVIAVLVNHAFPQLLPGGFTGLDVFFVLWAYLIIGIIDRPLWSGLRTIVPVDEDRKKCVNILRFFRSSRPSRYFLKRYSASLLD